MVHELDTARAPGDSDHRGIVCPNVDSGSCEYLAVGKYFIQFADLDILVSFKDAIQASPNAAHIVHEAADDAHIDFEEAFLKQEEVEKLHRFLQEYEARAAAPLPAGEAAGEAVNDVFILATTKLCPVAGCGNRATHFHVYTLLDWLTP